MRFTKNFLVPVLLIVLATIGSLAGGFYWMTGVQDRMAIERERQAVAYALNARIDFLRILTRDYSVWDDAVRNVVLKFDLSWSDENIGVYLFDNHGMEYNFIIDEAGRAVYAVVDGKHLDHPDASRLLGQEFEAASRTLLSSSQLGRAAGATMTPRGLALFAASFIQPSTNEVTMPRGVRRLLVTAKLVDQSVIEEVGQAAQGVHLKLQPASVAAASFPVRGFDGRPLGALIWTPQRPGTALWWAVIPWLAAFAGAVAALGAFVLLKARGAVTELVASEGRSRHLAYHDSLTGLPNRRAFAAILNERGLSGAAYTLLYMDLDGFKEVNDAYGHATGDALLVHTAKRLRRILPKDGYLARLGGDEFAVVLNGLLDEQQVSIWAERFVSDVRRPHELGGEPVVVGTSLGVAMAEPGSDGDEVVRQADIAMYAAKARGRDSWCRFDPSLDDGRRDRKSLEGELRRAIANEQIDVVFQPIVRASDGTVTAVEALARWTHPERGPIAPDIFIPVAEESGVIVELGRYVLRTACLAAREWPFKLAVNLSPAQFWDRGLVESVLDTLKACDFPADQLEFEITETYLLRRPEAAAEIISGLRRSGIKIALDDFGTGYASIGYLQRFELDFVKLDKSFVDNVATNTDAAEVAQAIIALGGALRLPIVAEGVETAAQAAILSTAGCSFLQGWHFGRPMKSAEVDATLIARPAESSRAAKLA